MRMYAYVGYNFSSTILGTRINRLVIQKTLVLYWQGDVLLICFSKAGSACLEIRSKKRKNNKFLRERNIRLE